MNTIIIAILQIALLLLKAYFHRNSDDEKAISHIRDAQNALLEVAQKFEEEVRFKTSSKFEVDKVQDSLESERFRNEPSQ